MQAKATKTIPEAVIPGGWVVGGESRLLDSWTPSNLVLWAPSYRHKMHDLVFSMDFEACVPTSRRRGWKGGLRQLMQVGKQSRCVSDSVILFDARNDSTSNVAHILENQISIVLIGLASLNIMSRYRDVSFIVRSDTPSYALRLYECLGFRTIASSDDVIEGCRLKFGVKSPGSSDTKEDRKIGAGLVAFTALRNHALSLGILNASDSKEGAVFLARRKRRTLTNFDEVSRLLTNQEFQTVYAEDLPIEEQIQTIAQAKLIFGLHGAAMGYQLFRDPSQHGVVMECFSSGFVTSWVRAMCFYGGDTWLGGQGELSLESLKYVLGNAHAHAHEADNYRLSLSSVSAMIRMAKRALLNGPKVNHQNLLAEIPPIEVEP